MSTSPRRIGQYELLQQIGNGHVGEVWKAHDLAQRRDVAVKILHNDLQADPNFLNRLTNGGKAITNLRHDNLVSVYDARVSRPNEARETTTFIVMDYIEGYTISDYLKATAQRGIFPATTDIVYLFSCLGAVVDYIHQQGIAHGDIKPSNILLNKQQRTRFNAGEPMLTDVGITQIAGNDSYLGAPHYLSPEQAQGQSAKKESDIYALGIILYELCTGATPFRGDNSFAVISQHINTLPTPPTLLNANIPPDLAQVILRALSKDPGARFSEGAQFAYAIAEACSVQPTHPAVRQIATRSQQAQTSSNPAQNNQQSILGVSQPLTPASPVFMRPLIDMATRQQSQAGQEQPISLNANPNVSAAAVFPNSGPLSSVTIQKNPGPASLPSTAPASGFPQSGPASVPPSGATSGPLSGASGKQFQLRQTSLTRIPVVGPDKPGLQFSLPSTPSSPDLSATQQSQVRPDYVQAEPVRPYPQQPDPAAYRAYQQQAAPQIPQTPPPLAVPPPTRPAVYKNKYFILIAALVLIAVIAASIGLSNALKPNDKAGQPAPAVTTKNPLPTPQGPGIVFFQDDALGRNDQLRITMKDIPDPAQGKVYYAWLQTNTQKFVPLGAMQAQNKQIDFMYAGDANHTNLINYTSGIQITLEDTGNNPTTPGKKVVYRAAFAQATLPEIQNILDSTPGLPKGQSAVSNMFETIKSLNDKAASIVDSLDQTKDYGLVKRQATRIIELIDGSNYARSSGDLPNTLPGQIKTPIGLLSSPNQPGYIDILDKHLDALKANAGNNANLQMRIQNAKAGLTDLRQWLQKMRDNDVQLLKATNLTDAKNHAAALQLKQLADYSYKGRTIPPDTSPKSTPGSAGASQTYVETQYMAALDLTAVK
ncbi:hypothetical protein KDA_11770 [Dictyobacter alpinus]|uniref:non-specific serine/threonine protein kinase n=1 Tax=Dictyobacter alpinus TaxID=2014873 RepID=A0A402B2Z4_9CHLR|nr:protein kinase [Dictyobacter alpinus]GCE25693.1 hypothetical protein KDA_11770 [Dictyobacter alpinus]